MEILVIFSQKISCMNEGFMSFLVLYISVISICKELVQHKEHEGSQCAKLKLEHTKKSFLYTGPQAWNIIPHLIRDTESIGRFKRDLKFGRLR